MSVVHECLVFVGVPGNIRVLSMDDCFVFCVGSRMLPNSAHMCVQCTFINLSEFRQIINCYLTFSLWMHERLPDCISEKARLVHVLL